MAAVLYETPGPAFGDELYVPPPDALGPDFKIVYTPGRNDGGSWKGRKRRAGIHIHISHIMGNSAVSPQGFANSEQPSGSTLSEASTFPAANSPWGKPTLLVSLPLDVIGAGSVDGCLYGITEESSATKGVTPYDANQHPWDHGHLALKVAWAAWLVENPLGWPMLDLRYQVCKTPIGSRPELGGFGFHSMWGDRSNRLAGGTNPWTLSIRTCPGYERRGYVPQNTHYDSILDSADMPGNFRAFLTALGQRLTPPPPEEVDMTPAQAQQLTDILAAVTNLEAKVGTMEPKVGTLWSHFDPTAPGPAAGDREGRAYWLIYKLLYGTDAERAATKADLDALATEVSEAVSSIELPPVVATVGPMVFEGRAVQEAST